MNRNPSGLVQEPVDRCDEGRSGAVGRILVWRARVNRILTGRGDNRDLRSGTGKRRLRAGGPDPARDSCADTQGNARLAACIRILPCLLLTLAAITSAQGTLIDDFTDGAVLLQASSVEGVTAVQTNLNPSAVLGGERTLYAGSISASRLEIDSTAGVCLFEATESFGYFEVSYGDIVPLAMDLSADGSDAFLLRFSDVYTPGIMRAPPVLRVNGVTYYMRSEVRGLSGGPIEVRIPFAAFDSTGSLIANSISFKGSRIEPTHRYVLDSIVTVPEPGTGLLLLLGIPLLKLLVLRPKLVYR